MKKATIAKMRKAHQKQAEKIKKSKAYERVSSEFDVEYAIAKELVEARQEAHMTQAQIAERMGTTQSVISRIERGANVSIETLERYACACGKHFEFQLV